MLLVFAALTCAQVAPGDEHDTCSNSIPSTDSNVVLLMTSKAYTVLLGEDGVWDEMDFDDNNPETSFQPTNVSRKISLCKSRSFDNSWGYSVRTSCKHFCTVLLASYYT